MSANSEKILFCVKLPNSLFWSFTEVAREIGETRSTIARRLIKTFVQKEKKKSPAR